MVGRELRAELAGATSVAGIVSIAVVLAALIASFEESLLE